MELYHLCKEFNALPSSGGLLDQDSYLVMLLKFVTAAYIEKENQTKPKSMKGTR